MISVIIPTHNRHENLIKSIIAIDSDEYLNKEIIVINDNSDDKGATRETVKALKETLKTNILYLDTRYDGYGLAMARNMGVIESLGDIYLFLDDRLQLAKDQLRNISLVPEGFWYYGVKTVKGKYVKGRPFIENFSWIHKKDFHKFGCFNERINIYGGTSQDIRTRWGASGGKFKQIEAYAKEISGSSGKYRTNEIWKAKLMLNKLYD